MPGGHDDGMLMDHGDPQTDELELVPDGRPPRRAWDRRWVVRAVVALGVLLLAGAIGVATTGSPDGTEVETAGRVADTGDDDEGRRPRERGDAADGERGEDGPGLTSTDGSSTRRKGDGQGRSSDGKGGKAEGSRKAGGSKGGGSSPTTTGPDTTVPGPGAPLVSNPSLPAFAPLGVASATPCAASTVRVELTAVGGALDGVVVLARDLAVAPDGTWSMAPTSVPTVGPVAGVPWAATAARLDVTAICGGGPRSAAAPVSLEAYGPAPSLAPPAWDGTRVAIEVTECPTEARIELVVGTTAPVPDRSMAATTTADLTADPDVPTTWRGSAAPDGFDPDTEGLWVTAACLHAPGGEPVWRYEVVQLDAP